ncbi:hypothetical protein Nepgr_008583 [Nepenthes gracilis]|uniref:Chaperone DnaJ C-terminal domain-containing protein n=1 Tax=Nepenthes gracilis TaxID=150966 RepID=A0AAD3S968_NEPGR|nr:hypothetical protein Nepgr_008583 [Nepenthes gracilis]
MGDLHRHRTQSTADFYGLLGGFHKHSSIKEIGKAYKNLIMRWHPEKHDKLEAKSGDTNGEYQSNEGKEDDKCSSTCCEYPSGSSFHGHRSVDDVVFSRSTSSSFLSRSSSRRSHTPTPSVKRSASRLSSESLSTRRGSKTPTPYSIEVPTLSKLMSQNQNGTPSTTPREFGGSLSRNTSRQGTTPIVFSRFDGPEKPSQPVEKKLECTLEELCFGTVKKIKITRDVINDMGIIVKEEEILKINVKPGWKKGTKIVFDGKGDEKPGYLPGDIIFSIEEKSHPVFKRVGDDLLLGVEVPLIKALTGCTISVPLLGAQKMTLKIDDIIYPEFEKVIAGQGMPKSKGGGGIRGDLRLKFLVVFPKELSDKQLSGICSVLDGCL